MQIPANQGIARVTIVIAGQKVERITKETDLHII